MNVALLTAAGSGTRMNLDIPKQFLHVDDKPVIIYTLEAFQNHPGIDPIGKFTEVDMLFEQRLNQVRKVIPPLQ